MAEPDFDVLLGIAWGWPDESIGLIPAFAAAANITVGSNPAYSLTDFRAIYPKFTSDLIPDAVTNVFISLASASLSQARWQDSWTLGMALFIAHYATLWLQSEGNPASTAGQAAQQGIARGIQTSKAVGDTSVSYQPLEALADWAAWNLTTYGQQFATMARVIGGGPMLIW